jgi:hypothetical protein
MAATEPGAAVETSPPAFVEQLLAIQEAPATVSREGRKSARQYGQFLLDRLEDIRLGLLAGAIPKDQLARLAQAVRQRRQRSDDPLLNEDSRRNRAARRSGNRQVDKTRRVLRITPPSGPASVASARPAIGGSFEGMVR